MTIIFNKVLIDIQNLGQNKTQNKNLIYAGRSKYFRAFTMLALDLKRNIIKLNCFYSLQDMSHNDSCHCMFGSFPLIGFGFQNFE